MTNTNDVTNIISRIQYIIIILDIIYIPEYSTVNVRWLYLLRIYFS